MYQRNINLEKNPFTKDGEFSESELTKLTKVFEETVVKLPKLNIKLDLSKTYVITHACIWNNVSWVRKKCKIVEHNSKIALIFLEEDVKNVSLIKHIYRLEDLSPFD